MNLKKPGLVAAIISTTLLLTGCTDLDVFAGTSDEKPAATVTPTPTPVPLEVGAVVEPDVELPKGQTAYLMPDGTHVVVDRYKPVPDAVLEDLTAKASAVNRANYLVNGDTMDTVKAARGQFEGDVVRATGKRPMIIWEAMGYPSFQHEEPVLFWAAPASGGKGYDASKAVIEANVADFIARSDEPEAWLVIWAQ